MLQSKWNGAVGFRVRMIFNQWWLCLFNEAGKNVGNYGPSESFAEVQGDIVKAKGDGLTDLERDIPGDKRG
jgi:hypothetical protein